MSLRKKHGSQRADVRPCAALPWPTKPPDVKAQASQGLESTLYYTIIYYTLYYTIHHTILYCTVLYVIYTRLNPQASSDLRHHGDPGADGRGEALHRPGVVIT